MLTQNLFENVLLDPAIQSADTLYIVSGYASATMVSRHFNELKKERKKVRIELIVGMAVHDGISARDHTGFQRLSESYPDMFICRYVAYRPSVHSKTYAWYSDSMPKIGFTGSANYTQSGFSRSRREAMIEHDARQARAYFDIILGDTVECRDPQVDDFITVHSEPHYSMREASVSRGERSVSRGEREVNNLDNFPRISLSHLDNRGGTGGRSGLNWGQRPGREQNQAYLRVPTSISRTNFFPPIGEYFTVITDDGEILICVCAQAGGKAIHTPDNNSQMGIYFRRRLGVRMGRFVEREDLERYGRTDVDFYKIDEETYYMDFSVSQRSRRG